MKLHIEWARHAIPIACVVLFASGVSPAADISWDGGGTNTNWTTAANWKGDKAWVPTNNAKFDSTFTSGTAIQLNGNQTVNELKIGTTTAFSLNGSTLTITSGKISRTVDTGTTTINSALALGGTGNADWRIKGNLVVNGNISGSRTIVKDDDGTLTLNGANTFTGGLTLKKGTLALGNNAALGTGTLLLDGTPVTVQSASNTGYTLANAVQMKNDATIAGTGALTFTGGYTLQGDKTLTVTNTAATTFSGAVFTADRARTLVTDIAATSGGLFITSVVRDAAPGEPLELTKTGGGTLTLSGNNSFTGGVMLSAGTLAVGSNTALGTGLLEFTDAGTGTLQSASTAAYTLANAIEMKGSATIGGSGALTLTGGLLVTDNNLTLTVNNTALTTFSGASISADNARTLNINVTSTSGGTVIASVIENKDGGIEPFSLTKSGGGDLTLTGTNTYTGVTTISGGTLSVATIGNGGAAGNLGAASSAASNLILAGGTLEYTGANASTNRNFTLTAGTTSTIEVTGTSNLTLTGASTATTGALTKTGSGTLTLAGQNQYSGLTTVAEGTLAYGTNNAIGSGGIAVNGGTLDLKNFSDTVSSVTLSGGGTIIGTGTLTMNQPGATYLLQDGSSYAVLAGSASATKTTAGTVILSGANTYTGGTVVTEGTLHIENTTGSATGSGSVFIGSNSTLTGSGIISGATTISGIHAAGNNIGTQTFNSSLQYLFGSALSWELDSPVEDLGLNAADKGTYDQIVVDGALTGGNAVFEINLTNGKSFADAFWDTDKIWSNIFTTGAGSSTLESIFTSFGGNGVDANGMLLDGRGQFTFNGNTLTYTNLSGVPEPSTLMFGLLTATALLRRRRAA